MHTRLKLPFVAALALSLPLTLVATAGCKDKGEEKKEVKVIEQAANGSPVAAELVEFIGEGEGRGMKVRLYNHGDKTAAAMSLLFRYYDGDDKLLKVKEGTPFEKDTDFTSVSGRSYKCKPKKNATIELEGMIVSVPAAATRAEIITTKVSSLADDGMKIEDWWSQDNFNEWPEG